MKRGNPLKVAVVAVACLTLTACAPEPGSARWCEAKQAQSKSEWSLDDAAMYAKHCLLEGTEVGSTAWCEKLAEKPRGQWTADEAASYAKHCVI
jgi:hypothetical protein